MLLNLELTQAREVISSLISDQNFNLKAVARIAVVFK
jgi:hypothetical protein